eukprot:365086-Chlamydomonas_euryale.AAC.16
MAVAPPTCSGSREPPLVQMSGRRGHLRRPARRCLLRAGQGGGQGRARQREQGVTSHYVMRADERAIEWMDERMDRVTE